MFTVATLSNQISQNHIAWANNYESFDSLKEAQEAAKQLWQKICNEADEAGTSYVGGTVIIHDGENTY